MYVCVEEGSGTVCVGGGGSGTVYVCGGKGGVVWCMCA